ncbi:Endonuclease/Exonuclease/phosphatase family protein [Micromonospora coriariae]|uniref:Endonuclease/Exonuclease/phosphatase family protein n=1 Tax=Micromonospora coriariae TaxID=285665 RepID=A0A1C4XBW0_9ACTN|nr:endonuclease/exonuclease/phosphatase family protein [Micromonospora coriariae]SCF05782.1 Endonuclease/Exonuclease/phosphatase family protein [Micromonospora coriariae]
MADRWYRSLRWTLAVVCLIAAAAVPARPPMTINIKLESSALRVLQMNLCNSGRAGCYTGRSVTAAAEVISAEVPDVVSLNEICRSDVPVLKAALVTAHPDGAVVSAFKAAGDRPSGAVTQCRNGEPYGIALLTRVEAKNTPYTLRSGLYPAQDATDPEERAWLCVQVPRSLHACTTHLAATSFTVALAQCRHLLNTVVPAISRSLGYAPTVVLGDLNLRRDRSPNVQSCVPPEYLRIDDGALQHVMTTADVRICCRRAIEMHGATDHPGLLVTVAIEGRHPGWTTVAQSRAPVRAA